MDQSPSDIFSIPSPFQSPRTSHWFSRLVAAPLEYLLGLQKCREIYASLAGKTDKEPFTARVLELFGTRCDIRDGDMDRIPAQGPTVVVANHPFGGIEGLILLNELKKVRPDVKVMANFILQRVPELADSVLPVDPFGGPDAARKNLAALKESIRWVQQGGALIIFPAGEVSHLSLRKREVADPPWSATVARIIRKTQAQVVPIFFAGHNDWLFQIAGLIHPRLRTLLLIRAFLKMRHRSIRICIGNSISWNKLRTMDKDDDMVAFLRLRTYVLDGLSTTTGPSSPALEKKSAKASGNLEPVAEQQFSELMANEINRLPRDQQLVESHDMEVWEAVASQIPYTLLEIARLREITFREVGEGSGNKVDTDRFDRYYTHLFIWHRAKQEIVGAYRLGKSDEILERHGRNGLYSHTLFRYRKKLFRKIGPALELGRSFIRPEYQRNFSSLLLLWKGIGQLVVKNPQYRILFGPVSISRDYSDLSRQIIAGSLQSTQLMTEWAHMVKPRMPLTLKPLKVKGCSQDIAQTFGNNMEEVSAMIAHIEIDQKGIPILLKHYLNLGGRLLAFNLDPEFSNVLDGLILVDLLQTDRKTLERYMGKTGMTAFLTYHELLTPTDDQHDCA